jgi:ankyrin repeat protein
MFLKHGFDPLAENNGMCAYMRAIRNRQYKVVECFIHSMDGVVQFPLYRKTDPAIKSNVEWPPLSMAASVGDLRIAELLVNNGADLFSYINSETSTF